MFKRIVESVHSSKLGGWHLSMLVLPGSDEMWVRYEHPAVFRDHWRASRFAKAVEMKPINLSEWIGEDWVGSPLRVDEDKNPGYYSVL